MLECTGVDVRVVVWDDPWVDWGAFDVVVVRSTWDYHERRESFVEWADAVAAVTRLCNPADVLRWNTDKRYLADLDAAGVPIVPTAFCPPGYRPVLPDHGEIVVKPTVSAGSRRTARYRLPDEEATARAHVETIHQAGDTVMLQPYVASVDEVGETALVFLGGAYSHAIRKGPILQPGAGLVGELFAAEDIAVRSPSHEERAIAEAALAVVPGGADRLVYARVDLVATADGPTVLELELSEPSLFLATAPGAAERLVGAIVAAAAEAGGEPRRAAR